MWSSLVSYDYIFSVIKGVLLFYRYMTFFNFFKRVSVIVRYPDRHTNDMRTLVIDKTMGVTVLQ